MTDGFANRAEAGRLLARKLLEEKPMHPVVLAIPRGGIEVAAPLAAALSADLDVVLARKLRAPYQRELAIGAISENGEVVFADDPTLVPGVTAAYVAEERARQMEEIARRRTMYRAVRPAVPLVHRHVIVTDDGIATGSTMIAALQTIRFMDIAHVTVAVPVASSDRLKSIRPLCDRLVCLLVPETFLAVGQFYESFEQVEDERVVELLEASIVATKPPGPSSSP